MELNEIHYKSYKFFSFLGVVLFVVAAISEFGQFPIVSSKMGKLMVTSAFISWGLSGIFGYLSNKPFSFYRFWADAGDRDDPLRAWGASICVVVTIVGAAVFLYQLA